jgi:hypothetical protein
LLEKLRADFERALEYGFILQSGQVLLSRCQPIRKDPSRIICLACSNVLGRAIGNTYDRGYMNIDSRSSKGNKHNPSVYSLLRNDISVLLLKYIELLPTEGQRFATRTVLGMDSFVDSCTLISLCYLTVYISNPYMYTRRP